MFRELTGKIIMRDWDIWIYRRCQR